MFLGVVDAAFPQGLPAGVRQPQPGVFGFGRELKDDIAAIDRDQRADLAPSDSGQGVPVFRSQIFDGYRSQVASGSRGGIQGMRSCQVRK